MFPSIEALRRSVSYDPETGVFVWIDAIESDFADRKMPHKALAIWKAKCAGKPAFNTVSAQGYLVGNYLRVKLAAHRVAFALHYGRWPTHQIDHINGIRTDNRIANLREATNAENGRNLRKSKANRSGRTGVCWDRQTGRWQAAITVAGKSVKIGRYASFEEACLAREAAERKYSFHENHGT